MVFSKDFNRGIPDFSVRNTLFCGGVNERLVKEGSEGPIAWLLCSYPSWGSPLSEGLV
jgi:hypothetical protein